MLSSTTSIDIALKPYGTPYRTRGLQYTDHLNQSYFTVFYFVSVSTLNQHSSGTLPHAPILHHAPMFAPTLVHTWHTTLNQHSL